MIRVLLVDDEPAFVDMLKFFLEREKDISVNTSQSAGDALDRLAEESYDVILSDFSMPGMDGIEFLKVVRIQGMNIPFIMLTGRGREDVAIQALNNGANFYVQKRGDPKAEVVELVSAIRQSAYQLRALESAQSLRQTVEAVVHASPLPIVATDMEGRITLWSEAAERLFGWTSEEAIKHEGVLACEELSSTLKTLFAEAIDGKDVAGVRVKVTGKSGSTIEVAVSMAAVRDENGRPIGMISIMRDIPSIEHVDAELLRSEDLYRVLAESLRDSVYIINSSGVVRYVNRQVAESLDAPVDNVIGQPAVNVLTGSAWSERIEGVKMALESGQPVHLHDSAVVGETTSWFDTWLIPLKGEESGAVAVLGVSRNITEHKLLEDTITAARDVAENIIDDASVLVVGLDSSGAIQLFNKMAEEMSGYSRKEVIGRSWLDFIGAGSRHHELAGFFPGAESANPQIPGSLIHSIVTREGDTRYISWETKTVGRPGGPKGVISFGIDITEIEAARRALKDGESRMRLITQNMKDMITQFDTEGHIVYASPSHKATLGYDPSELVGVHILDLVHPDDAGTMSAYIRKASETHRADAIRFRCRKTDGSYVWLESTGSIVLGTEGGPSGAVFGSRDITERRNVEMALKSANEKLNLLSGLTRHDVDNQMSILMGWLEIARQSVADDAILKALDSARGAAYAISRQMEFASDYQDMGVKSPIWLSLSTVCNKILKHLDLAGITVNNRTEDLLIFGDPLIEKVCANLMENVVRHGVKATRIEITCEERPDGLLVVFEDDGVGVPVENKERIFDRGFGKNTGLGLYLARAALDITGIKIRESGVPGKGARFELLVPEGRYRLTSSDNS